ncbi:hypothetical protein AADZ86_16395 [Colwelliaceae bacterium BS250]
MKLFNKTSLALSLSLLGAASIIPALASDTEKHVQEVIIEAHDDSNSSTVHIFVDVDGDITNVTIPKDALGDKDKLAEALADVPEDVRDKLISDLENINMGKLHKDTAQVHVKHHGGDHQKLNSVNDSGDQKLIIIEIDDENGEHKQVLHKEMTIMKDSSDHEFIEFKGDDKIGAESIIKLLSHGEYSAEELDKIQKALDAKR